jgi:hypothetical protein
MDDYTPEEYEEICDNESKVNFLNCFLCYYKNLFNTKKETTMFDDIDYTKENSTNRQMEFIFNELEKFADAQEHTPEKTTLMDIKEINLDSVDELYVLVINNKQEKMCQLLVPLIEYIAEKEWLEVDWSIMTIKSQY